MTTLYHGSHCNANLALHEGICLTDDESVASHYGRHLHTVEIDLDTLTVEECPGYDRDENDAPADHDDYRAAAVARGVDVLVYDDEDEMGQRHDCYRLVSERALAAVRELV